MKAIMKNKVSIYGIDLNVKIEAAENMTSWRQKTNRKNNN